MKTGIVYDPIYLKHDTGQHPENYSRLQAIMAHLEKTGLLKELTPIKARPATTEELAMVHEKQLINRVQEMALRGGGWLDADTVMSADSYEAALYAAGGMLNATEAVLKGEVNSAFALVRPPGHHATPSRAMGFCLFNNIAVAARMALSKYKLERIAIIDFDVHHGNGTQDTFYNSRKVLYISTHEYPFYPGSGSEEETGNGEGKGFTINIPLPAYSGDDTYLPAFKEIIVPAVKRYRPQLILVSAGYDNHWSDPLAMMKVTISGFAEMARIIRELADELCEGRVAITLEGGYNNEALAYSIKATFDVLLGKKNIDDPMGSSQAHSDPARTGQIIEKIKKIHGLS